MAELSVGSSQQQAASSKQRVASKQQQAASSKQAAASSGLQGPWKLWAARSTGSSRLWLEPLVPHISRKRARSVSEWARPAAEGSSRLTDHRKPRPCLSRCTKATPSSCIHRSPGAAEERPACRSPEAWDDSRTKQRCVRSSRMARRCRERRMGEDGRGWERMGEDGRCRFEPDHCTCRDGWTGTSTGGEKGRGRRPVGTCGGVPVGSRWGPGGVPGRGRRPVGTCGRRAWGGGR